MAKQLMFEDQAKRKILAGVQKLTARRAWEADSGWAAWAPIAPGPSASGSSAATIAHDLAPANGRVIPSAAPIAHAGYRNPACAGVER